MCGIAGVTRRDSDGIARALATMSYRGPDASGTYGDDHVTLGHARLSIIDVDSRSDQPMLDEARTHAIVFNGEIYNYKDIRDTLQQDGIRFDTESDTEVLLKAYMQWGEGMLPRLRGMFAFCIYDARTGVLFLARDHAGIKPLYYSLAGGLSFASELKTVVSLLRGAGAQLSISQTGLDLFQAFGYIPSPLTLVNHIEKLERASWLRFDTRTKRVETGRWVPDTAPADTPSALQALVTESILEHTIADVPVGLFFSGGIDSSVIAMVLQRAGKKLETFSVEVEGRDADAPYFAEIARRLGVRSNKARFGIPEAETMLDVVFSRMDDPIADSSILPTAFVSGLAAEKVKVVLSGEGGDELFQGYPRQIAIAGIKAVSASGILERLRRALPHVKGTRRVMLALSLIMRDPAFYYLMTTSLAQDLATTEAWEAGLAVLKRIQPTWYDRDLYLENMLLRKADMATMYASIEGRVPLLGAQVWNAAPRFVSENLEGGSKMILREMLYAALPRELVDRPKSGFGISTRRLFAESEKARSLGRESLAWARRTGLLDVASLGESHPAYLFGMVALHNSLKNIGLE